MANSLIPVPINPPPGVVLTESDRVAEGRYTDATNIRFVKGRAQKLGGNVVAVDEAVSGTPRATHAWRDNVQNNYLAVGTYRKLYVYDSSWLLNDITPYRAEGSFAADPFAVVAGSDEVTVTHLLHGLSVGDTIEIADSANVNGTTWAAAGNAQLDTADKKFGTASLLLDGTGDWVTTADDADYALGSGDFTIETFFKCNTAGGTVKFLAGQMDNASTTTTISFFLQRTAGNVIVGVVYVGGTAYTVTGTTQFTNAVNTGWHHVALVRVSGVLKLFIDGVQEGANVAAAVTVNDSAYALRVGAGGEYATAPWIGWLDEFRISIGVARYITTFTPPVAAFTSDQYTKVLLHFDGADAATTITDSAGITPNGTFLVSSIISSGSYTFLYTEDSPITSSGGGAAATFKYEVPIGVELGVYGLGWGVGAWGHGAWGEAHGSSTIYVEPRVWSLDHFGQLLIASYNGGSIYYFDPTDTQPWDRALIVSADPGLPTDCRFVFVTPERFIFALLDGMQVAWPSQGTIDDWTPTSLNTANIRTLTEGTKLVAGRVLSDFISLVWSDAALYRFQYTGSAYIYNSSMIAKDCGLLSPGGAVTASGVAYWIGQDTFWMYNGSVTPIPNVEDIRKYVFDALKVDYGYQCTAIMNPQHNEIWFFYTVEGETNPTLGVIYSIANQCWAPLDYGRTSGTHFTQGDTRPYMAAADGYIYQHENGLDNNGVAAPWSLTMAPFVLNEGGSRMDISEFTPDFHDQVGDITMTMTTWDRLNDTLEEDAETEVITAMDSGSIDMRLTGRYVGIVFGSTSAGCYMRMGKPVMWIEPAGDRR